MQINFLKLIPYIIIIGLVIALSITQCSKQSIKEDNSEQILKDKINEKERELVAIRNDGEEKRQRWIKDSLQMEARATASKVAETKARKEADKALNKIADIVQTNPDVKDFVHKDSIADKAATDEKKALELDKVTMNEAFRDILHSKDEQLKVKGEIIIHLEDVIVEKDKTIRKERGLKTFWKVTTGIVAAVLLFEIIKD